MNFLFNNNNNIARRMQQLTLHEDVKVKKNESPILKELRKTFRVNFHFSKKKN
jgi:hypothetical protein